MNYLKLLDCKIYNPKYISPLHNTNTFCGLEMEVKYLALATINAIIQIL